MNVVIYARAATDDRGDGAALARQARLCREWAEEHGCTVVGVFTEVASGHAADLPELGKALDLAQAEKAALLCASPDRLARRLDLFLRRVKECKRRGIIVLYANLS